MQFPPFAAALRRLRKAHHGGLQVPAQPYPMVNLVFWRPDTQSHNFGDHLSKIVVDAILAGKGRVLEEEVPKTRNLLAVGSILHFANTGDVIWGSGVNGKIAPAAHRFTSLDVRAVRGPLTRDFLQELGIQVPPVYGDPALLLPRLFPGRFRASASKPYVVVPNLHDLRHFAQLPIGTVVSPMDSWNRCVEEILQAELVIASSLHGLIIAEAFGIPARYLRVSQTESLFKYRDYVLGTGRTELVFAKTVDQALEMGGMEHPTFDSQALLDAFPWDLWKGPLAARPGHRQSTSAP
ncbi:polysaccharide pyruvyl transferase family protein [uncultured Ramlibacter sp.]|mgnify:CR=1 FL=1|uniref:polysaccharide pyruvyl transferase family protein n=1 Tax=uncultured Ramlibacter sp. TaxID=260755 RepID=UPI002639A80C|nr:polysaccharide pyruvyl transferase family protein [uncultured Ramlibacter sp.]